MIEAAKGLSIRILVSSVDNLALTLYKISNFSDCFIITIVIIGFIDSRVRFIGICLIVVFYSPEFALQHVLPHIVELESIVSTDSSLHPVEVDRSFNLIKNYL